MARLVLLALAVLFAATGCIVQHTEVVRIRHADGSAPVQSTTGPGERTDHVVVRGETLYSIAFRSRLDWRQVAAWNGLAAPYTIYPGQRLRLAAPAQDTLVDTPASGQAALPGAAVTSPVVDEHVAPPAAPAPAVVAAPPAAAPPEAAAAPAPRPAVAPTAPPASGTSAPAAVPATPLPAAAPGAAATRTVGGVQWRWPTQGEVIRRYRADDLSRQGIGIAGSSGQAVVAAADGQVVYSGSGLRGYGELIIIKHSAEYLSAYGHNRRRLVNEGEQVRAGQPIAELGRTGADRDMLHFEIRRGGNPVDPAGFLPRR